MRTQKFHLHERLTGDCWLQYVKNIDFQIYHVCNNFLSCLYVITHKGLRPVFRHKYIENKYTSHREGKKICKGRNGSDLAVPL